MKDEQKPVLRNGDQQYAKAKSLFDNGYYTEAYIIFEDLFADPEYCDRTRVAAALCCLEIAQNAVVEGLRRFPNHPVLLNDRERISSSKLMLGELERQAFPGDTQRGSRS